MTHHGAEGDAATDDTKPAMICSSIDGNATNTLTLTDFRFEVNNAPDLRFTGGGAAGASNTTGTNFKFEGGLHNGFPYIDLTNCLEVILTGVTIASHRENAAIRQESGISNAASANQFIGLNIHQIIAEQPDYMVDVQAGALKLDPTMRGDPTLAHVHAETGVLADGVTISHGSIVSHPNPDGTTTHGLLHDER